MKHNLRPWQWAAIGLATLVILTLSVAPFPSNIQRAGSSYGRTPDGYAAWYHQMQTQACIGRWHRPLSGLTGAGTFIQVFPNLEPPTIPDSMQSWVEEGNTLIQLGVNSPVTLAPFATDIKTDIKTDITDIQKTGSSVRIATRRRKAKELALSDVPDLLQQPQLSPPQTLLGDPYGAVVWQFTTGKGRVIRSTTPYLAANAYQDQPGNFSFLTRLATPKQGVIWMDEHQSGYRPSQKAVQEDEQQAIKHSAACQQQLAQGKIPALASKNSSLGRESRSKRVTDLDPFLYLLNTPIGLVVLQGFILLILLLVAKNRRFGLPHSLSEKTQDNTTAYIHALATVLHKANCSGFVVSAILKAEQRYVQQRLGLGVALIEPRLLLDSWLSQGYNVGSLERALLHPPANRCRQGELIRWLESWQQVRLQLSNAEASYNKP